MPFTRFMRFVCAAGFVLAIVGSIGALLLNTVGIVLISYTPFLGALSLMLGNAIPVMFLAAIGYQLCLHNESTREMLAVYRTPKASDVTAPDESEETTA